MRNPFLSHFIICNSCKKSCKARGVDKWTKQQLYKSYGIHINVSCRVCGFTPQHINRLYAELNYMIVVPLLLSFVAASYWLGQYLFETYWRDTPMLEDDVMAIVFMGYISPLALGGLVLTIITKERESFNIRL